MIAFLEPYLPQIEEDMTLGTIRFRSLGKPGVVSLPYLELVDQDYQLDTHGAKPVIYLGSEKPSKRGVKRDLGNGIWWTEAYPNPFDSYTRIDFSLPDTAFITIDVVDAQGRVVRPLIGSTYKGTYTTTWVGKDFGGDPVERGEYQLVLKVRDKVDRQDLHYVAEGDGETPRE
jgi:hypothetical protein